MAEPKKKLSKTRTNRRRAKYSISGVSMVVCKNCGQPARPHFVCGHCGFYNGKSVKASMPTKRIVLDEKTEDTKK